MAQPRFRHKPRYPWYEAYISALFETETDCLEDRISEAERELVARERELFKTEEYTQERNAVIAALHALTALRACNGPQREIA